MPPIGWSRFSLVGFILKPFVSILLEPFSKKQSHFWNWRPYTQQPWFLVDVEGDFGANPAMTPWAVRWGVNFGWKTVVILEPRRKDGSLAFDGEYRIGYRAGRITELCSHVLLGRCAVVVGPEKVYFFAVSHPEGRPIRLGIVEHTTRSKLPANIPLV